jgi:hypothetical protein
MLAASRFFLPPESLSRVAIASTGHATWKTEPWSRLIEANLARDGQGRIYREHVSFVPANSSEQSQRKYFTLSDPVARTRTTCVLASHRCVITGYFATTSFKVQPAGSFDDGKRFLTRESLGSDVIDGLNVVGTRETISINAGVLGNNHPLVSTREFWYSPDLQVNLSVTRKDPREGTQTIHVMDLSRSEPDPAMFQVPAGFVVQELHKNAKAKTDPLALRHATLTERVRPSQTGKAGEVPIRRVKNPTVFNRNCS